MTERDVSLTYKALMDVLYYTRIEQSVTYNRLTMSTGRAASYICRAISSSGNITVRTLILLADGLGYDVRLIKRKKALE